MARSREADPVVTRTVALRRSQWAAVDVETRRRGWTRSALFARLLDRAGIVGLSPTAVEATSTLPPWPEPIVDDGSTSRPVNDRGSERKRRSAG